MTEYAKTIRLGMVGCGGITQLRHLPALRQVRGIEVVALSDLDAARLESVAVRFGIARRHADYRELIGSDVDAIAVCVPPQFHAEVAATALAAGKHVFVEKPLALSLEECDDLSERATRDTSLKAMVCFNLRWHRLMLEAREIVRRGELGEIKLVRTVFTSGVRLRADFADWRGRRESGGGVLFELGVHHFDLLRFLLSCEVREIYASSVADDETAIACARADGGAQIVSAFSDGTGENHEIEIYGARGWLRVALYRADGLEYFGLAQYPGALGTRLRKLKRTIHELPGLVRRQRRGGDGAASYATQWQHFADAVSQDKPVECTLDDGRRALEIALAAMRAGGMGSIVLSHGEAKI